jgi:hypothetical protein
MAGSQIFGRGIFRAQAAVMMSALLCLSACTVTLIAPYDDQTNASLNSLQTTTEQFFVAVERQLSTKPDKALSPYDKTHTDFFDSAKVLVANLKIRAGAISKNAQTQKEVQLMAEEFTAFEALDKKDNGLSAYDVQAERSVMETYFRALITLEMAKKNATAGQ